MLWKRHSCAWSDAVRLAPETPDDANGPLSGWRRRLPVLVTNPKIRHGVKLDLQLIEADRVSGELRWFEDDTSVDGISYDRWGNPTDYRGFEVPSRGHPVYAGGRCDPHSGGIHDSHLTVRIVRDCIEEFPKSRPALPLFAQLRKIQSGCAFSGGGRSGFAAILYHGRSAERRIG